MNFSRSPSGAQSRTRGTFTRCPAGQCKALTERGHGTNPGLHLPFWQMTVPDQALAASGIGLVSMGGEKRVQLGFNRLCNQLPRTLAQQIRRAIAESW